MADTPRQLVTISCETTALTALPDALSDDDAVSLMTAVAVARPADLATPAVPYVHVQQHQLTGPDGALCWQAPEYRPVWSGTAAEALAGLWARRKDRDRVRIPGGLEFGAYGPGCAPCPELQGARVRVWFETPEGVV